MGYLFLSVALLAGATKGFCGKKTSDTLSEASDALWANLLRMLLCILPGVGLCLLSGEGASLAPTPALLGISLLSGAATAIFVVTWLLAVRQNAYMLVDVFLMLGVLLPLGFDFFVYGEAISPLQLLGIAILLFAVLLLCSYSGKIKGVLSLPALLLLLACGAANGLCDLSQRLFVRTLPNVSASAFQFYTYLFAAAGTAVALPFFRRRGKRCGPLLRRVFPYIAVMAACLFLNSLFKTEAARYLPSVLLYPLNQGVSLLLSTWMAVIFFRERMTARGVCGILLAFGGLLLINVFG